MEFDSKLLLVAFLIGLALGFFTSQFIISSSNQSNSLIKICEQDKNLLASQYQTMSNSYQSCLSENANN